MNPEELKVMKEIRKKLSEIDKMILTLSVTKPLTSDERKMYYRGGL